MNDNEKRLTLSRHPMIWGVCGGIAEYFALDPSLVRIAYVLLTCFTAFSGVFLYPILYWIIPRDNKYLD